MNEFIRDLKNYRAILTRQQLQTLKGQAMSGNVESAKKGLSTLLNKNKMQLAHDGVNKMNKVTKKRRIKKVDYRGQFEVNLKFLNNMGER